MKVHLQDPSGKEFTTMIIIPLGLARELLHRPLISVVLMVLLFYQFALVSLFPQLAPNYQALLQAPLTDWTMWLELVLHTIRGQGPAMTVFLFIFWLLVGPVLEEYTGAIILTVTWLIGGVAPYFLMRYGIVAIEQGYWPGLGATLACLGLAYYFVWEEDYKVFTFIPLAFSAKYDTLPGIFIVGFSHLCLCLSQYVPYQTLKGETAPPGLGAEWFALIFPLAITGICFLTGKVLHQFSGNRDESIQGTAVS